MPVLLVHKELVLVPCFLSIDHALIQSTVFTHSVKVVSGILNVCFRAATLTWYPKHAAKRDFRSLIRRQAVQRAGRGSRRCVKRQDGRRPRPRSRSPWPER